MAYEMADARLSIGFLDDPSAQTREFVVPVTELSQVLAAFQGAVFAAAAYELNLSDTRRLTDLQRKQYSLAVVSFRLGSLWADLMPFVVVSLMNYQQVGTLFPPDVLGEISVESVKMAWSAVMKALGVMKKQFDGDDQEPRIDRVIGRHTAEVAKAAINNGQTIEIISKDPSGAEFSFRTTQASSLMVLARKSDDPEVYGTFTDLLVKDIMTTVPVFNVSSPKYPQDKIRCEYPKGEKSIYGHFLNIGERVTVSGTGIWTDPNNLSDFPNKIIVSRVETSQGMIIGQRRFEQPA